MRGTRKKMLFIEEELRIIPAYAGNTFVFINHHSYIQDHPRLCGEHKVFLFHQ